MPPSTADVSGRGLGAGRGTAGLLLGFGAVGLIASLVLLIEKLELLKDSNYEPSCSINPVLSCGSVMKTWQAELLGFPNPVIGIVGFTVIVTTAAALMAGAVLSRWYWYGLLAGAVAGTLLVQWLVFQSLYRISALCPYCMVVWVVTVVILATVLTRLATTLHLPRWVADYLPSLVVLWLLVVVGLILVRFWYYWSTLL